MSLSKAIAGGGGVRMVKQKGEREATDTSGR